MNPPNAADWRQGRLIKRTDKVDTPRMLQVAQAAEALWATEWGKGMPTEQMGELLVVPIQGGVSAEERLTQALRARAYWPDFLLSLAAIHDVPWHTLAEPPRWDDVDPVEVFEFVEGFVERGKWPSVGDLRRKFGRRSNHARPGDEAEQDELF